jgi:FtsP/CotA-like multicopper oxidase with cupredoxin domain
MTISDLNRRSLLRGAGLATGAMLLGQGAPIHAETMTGEDITLRIGRGSIAIDGRHAPAITINGSVPGPTLRLKQGQTLRLTVINELDEATSLHWHGLLLPFEMDGVPGVSFPGIPPRGRFTYTFPIIQSGTYWYHSHSGFQEVMGVYAPIVIEPAQTPAPMRDHIIMLSDHSFTAPQSILRNLKADPGHYNRQPRTLFDHPVANGLSWAKMRMDPTDIADVTGAVLHYLVNGRGPADNWTALFTPGEPVKLRFINGAGMTFFNIRIPALPLTMIAADGQDIRPVTVDEFQIAPGETYDVLVHPGAQAHTIVAESMDRSGMARATLAPAPGMVAPVPPLRARPVLTMRDMGMGDMDMHGHTMKMRDGAIAPQVHMGPGVEMIAPMPADRTGDPGIGLADVGHRVLTYRDLIAAAPMPDPRAPEREIEVHLTGAMDRYMWSMDGQVMSHDNPIPLRTGERVRITLINDTMMAHPIHLHGHLFDLVTGHGENAPRKHTVTVLPGGKVSVDTTAQAGDWAFHCHLFLHMAMGMMRVVQVRPGQVQA